MRVSVRRSSTVVVLFIRHQPETLETQVIVQGRDVTYIYIVRVGMHHARTQILLKDKDHTIDQP